MSIGILEQIRDNIALNTEALNRIAASGMVGGGAPAQGQPITAAPAYVAPTNIAPVQPAPTNVTVEQITALIQPHIGNEAIKAALGVAMRALGINALPETPAHLYGQLYQSFQGVLAQHGIGGAAPAPVAAASII